MTYQDSEFDQNLQRQIFPKPAELSGLDYDAILQNLEGYKVTPSGSFTTQDNQTIFALEDGYIGVQGDGVGKEKVRIGKLPDGTYGLKILGGAINIQDANGNEIINSSGLVINSSSSLNIKKRSTSYTQAGVTWANPIPSLSFSLTKRSLVIIFATVTASIQAQGAQGRIRVKLSNGAILPDSNGIIAVYKDQDVATSFVTKNTASFMYPVFLDKGNYSLWMEHSTTAAVSVTFLGSDNNENTFIGYIIF